MPPRSLMRLEYGVFRECLYTQDLGQGEITDCAVRREGERETEREREKRREREREERDRERERERERMNNREGNR